MSDLQNSRQMNTQPYSYDYTDDNFDSGAWGKSTIPLILKIWTIVACAYLATFQTPILFLPGFRAGHVFYWFEFLTIPSILILVFRGFRKVPPLLVVFGVWVLFMGAVGFFKGHFPSMVYDRTRNFSVLIFLALLFSYEISSDQLLRLLKPLFISAWIGNVLVILTFLYMGLDEIPPNMVSFNWLGGVYCVLLLTSAPKPWILAGLAFPFAYAFFGMVRGAMISMFGGLVLLFTLYLSRMKLSMILVSIGIGIVFLAIYNFAPVSEAFIGKDIRQGGMEASTLELTTQARLRELTILKENLHGPLQWFFGLGTGAKWSGTGFYATHVGTERYTFHIYYAQLIYNFGLLGLTLFLILFAFPVVKGVLMFFHYDIVGQTCIIFMASLLVSLVNSAADTWIEVFAYSCALYGMHVGRVRLSKEEYNANQGF